jgi:hypothetical protein
MHTCYLQERQEETVSSHQPVKCPALGDYEDEEENA